MSKELKSLLENAQDAVLREINSKAGFLQKLLGANDKSGLREAQSAIAKAINQLGKSTDNEPNAKLQTHLNEKSKQIKELESQLELKKEALELAQEKAKGLESELQKAKQASQQTVTAAAPVSDNRELEELKQKLETLQGNKEELERKFSATKQELEEAWDLGLEFNKRLKKLKIEILAQ